MAARSWAAAVIVLLGFPVLMLNAAVGGLLIALLDSRSRTYLWCEQGPFFPRALLAWSLWPISLWFAIRE